MSDIITVPGRTINSVTAEIICLTEQGQRMALASAIAIGKRLVEAKEMVPHGEWGDYLKKEINYSHSTANTFMLLFKKYGTPEGNLDANSQTFRNLTYSKALKLLAVPDEEREEFAQQNDVANKSTRELDRLIKERDEALRAKADADAAAETAIAERRKAEHELLDLQQRAAAAKSSEDAWQAEIDKLNAALNKATSEKEKADKKLKDLKANPKVPPSVLDKLTAEAAAKAEEAARAELQGQLDEAKKQAAAAAGDKATAEKAARDAEEKLAAAQKVAKLSGPDASACNFLFEQIQTDFNRLTGHILKIRSTDPQLADQLTAATKKLMEKLKEKVQGGSGNAAM